MTNPVSKPSTNLALTRGYPICLTSAVIWSLSAIFIRYLTETYHLPPLVLAFWRDTIVAVSVMGVLAVFRPSLLRLSRSNLFYLALYGLVLSFFNALWTTSVVFNGAAVATVMSYSSVGFTALLAWWLLKEQLNWAKWLAVILSIAGTVLISGAADPSAWSLNLMGIVTGALSGIGFAAYSMMGRSASHRGLNPWTTLAYTFGFAGFFLLFWNLLPFSFTREGGGGGWGNLLWLGNNWTAWLILFILAVGPSAGGYGLYNVSLVYLSSSVANIIVNLEPIFTAIFAYIIFREWMTPPQLFGSLMILMGVVVVRLYEGRMVKTVEVEAGVS